MSHTGPLDEPLASRRWPSRIPSVVAGVLIVTALFSTLIFSGSELVFTQTSQLQQQQARLMEARAHTLQLQYLIQRVQAAQWAYRATGQPAYVHELQQMSRQALMHYGLLKGSLPPLTQLHGQVDSLGNALQKDFDTMSATAPRTEAPGDDVQDRLQQVQALDLQLQAQAQTAAADLATTLRRQRVGLAVLVGLNLLFLSALAAKTLRHFYAHEKQRLSLSTKAQELEEAVHRRTNELHDLTTYLQRQSELEKSRLAQELHDELGALLTSAKLDLAWLQGRNPGLDPARTERLKKLSRVLDQALGIKRKVIDNLRPSLLDHLGLTAALPWYVQETCDKAGLIHHVRVPPEGLQVDTDAALALYRIVQEALNNTIQHARAHEVHVDLVDARQDYVLRIQDDGVGIRDLRPDHLSHGIAGMRHRARAIGAQFTIQSKPGSGTSIEVKLPKPVAHKEDSLAPVVELSSQEALGHSVPSQLGVAG
ncbi:MAG: sensor histidine kinase [Acidobacteriota bacterium]